MASGATSTSHLRSLFASTPNSGPISSNISFPIERSTFISFSKRRLSVVLMSSGPASDRSKLIQERGKDQDFSVSAMSDGVTDCLDGSSLKSGQ